MHPETIEYSREKLYEEVWAEPMLKVAERYGVSSTALAKTCRKLGVPTPMRGYWAQKAAGQAPRQPRLPAPKVGQKTTLKHVRWRSLAAPPRQAPRVENKDSVGSVVVPAALGDPHQLVNASLAKLRGAAKSARWDAAPDETRLDIRVTTDALDRAILLMDTLIRELEARAHVVEVTPPRPDPGPDPWGRPLGPQPSTTRVSVDGEWVSICISELSDFVEPTVDGRGPGKPRAERRPNGRLWLRILDAPVGWDLRRSWSDSARQPLERHLGKVIDGIRTVGRAKLAERSERENRERQAAEAERTRQQQVERQRLEQLKLDDLASRVLDHVQAEEIRGYLRAVETYIGRNGPVGPERDIKDWIEWARGVADSLETNAIRTLLAYRPPPAP